MDPIATVITATHDGPRPFQTRSATSRAAYEYLVEHKVLSRRRMQVYTTLFLHGAMTRNELNVLARRAYKDPAQYDKRLADLLYLGCIAKNGTRVCSVTGQTCDVWDITDRIPTKQDGHAVLAELVVKRPSKEEIRTAVKQLRRVMKNLPPVPLKDPEGVLEATWRMSPEAMPPALVKVCQWLAYLGEDFDPEKATADRSSGPAEASSEPPPASPPETSEPEARTDPSPR